MAEATEKARENLEDEDLVEFFRFNFPRVSRRILADYIEKDKGKKGDETTKEDCDHLVFFAFSSGDFEHTLGSKTETLFPKIYVRSQDERVFEGGTVSRKSPGWKPTAYMPEVADLPIAFLRALDWGPAHPKVQLDALRSRGPELVLLCAAPAEPGSDPMPLRALGHLLAAAIVREMEEDPDKRGGIHLVILGHDGRDTHLAWLAREGDRAFRPPQDAPHHLSADALRALCEEDDPPKRLHTRIIVVAPHAWRPAHDLGKLEGLRRAFDRIIYVTARMPLEHPPRMLDLLADCYREGNEAFYTSFVATVIGAPKGTPTASGSFRARILPDPAIDREPVVGARLFRDAVRLPVAPDYIRRLWSRGPPPTRAFIDQVPPIVRARARRWARAVTNRRVGVALSGGGASAFRAAGLLEVFDEQDIPVDVLVGLSGGALVGAYYCANTIGRVRDAASAKKFAKIEARGPMLQRALPLGVLSTYLLERWVDEDLGGIRVEDQDVRFVAVATELAVGDEPRSVVIESGTMGEAVRASGSLPPTLAPMWKEGARYTDGGAASIVPAQVARDCGADIVFACNVIPRAALSNPLERYGLGQFVQEFTPLGRILDAWTWYAHLWSGASRRYGRLADVFLEFEPQDLPFVEGARDFSAGARIRGDAQRGKELREKVGAFNRHFLTLSR